MLLCRNLHLRLDHLVRWVERKLDQTQLFQRCQSANGIILAKYSSDMGLDLSFAFAIHGTEYNEGFGTKYVVSDWYHDDLGRARQCPNVNSI